MFCTKIKQKRKRKNESLKKEKKNRKKEKTDSFPRAPDSRSPGFS